MDYYSLRSNHTVEGYTFSSDVSGINMASDVSSKNLKINRDKIKNDERLDYSDKVNDPRGYGYVQSLMEVRNSDAKEILEREKSILALGAVAGVSLIVLGLLITSVSNDSA